MKTTKRAGRTALKTDGAQDFDPSMNLRLTRKEDIAAASAKTE
jgi:hypothetical protein